MIMILVLILVGVLVYAGACTVSGLQPSPMRLANFVPDPDFGRLSRRFHGATPDVRRAFTHAVRSAPGMSVIDEDERRLLVDSKPSVLVMDGNYGLVVELDFASAPDGDTGDWTEMTVQAVPKVGWALATRQRASLIEIERSLRMSAKRCGLLSEIVG